MKQTTFNIYFLVLASALFLIACNEPATTSEKNEKDTASVVTNNDTSSMPAYDPAMDALNVGPQFTKKLADTLNIKMYEFTVKPGESWALHNHPDHTVYVLQGGKIALFIQAVGRQDTLTFPTGMALISGESLMAGLTGFGETTELAFKDFIRSWKQLKGFEWKANMKKEHSISYLERFFFRTHQE